MTIRIPHYISIKDRYCIYYPGFDRNHFKQLKDLRPQLEEMFFGVEIHLCVHERLKDEIEDLKNSLTNIDLKNRKNDFAYIRQLKITPGTDPIASFAKESNVQM